MKCPVCDVDLKMSERQGVEIDYCPKCRGVWLDRGELDKLIERSTLVETVPPVREFDEGYDIKRKNDYYDDRRDYGYGHGRKKKSLLGEIFDIFD